MHKIKDIHIVAETIPLRIILKKHKNQGKNLPNKTPQKITNFIPHKI